MIEVGDLVKRYGDTTAVDGVTFEVAPAELFGLLGPNGAGKSTMIGVLSCLLRPTSGRARIGGHDVTTASPRLRRIIGVVPQDVALYPTLSARANLHFWGGLYGLKRRELRRRVEEILDLVGLTDRAGGRIETFSGGMKRRINIAAGLIHSPQVLFLDEPTVGVDPQSRRQILDLVRRLRGERGVTVVYTTHYMEEASEICDRIGVIDHGRLIALGTLDELKRSHGDGAQIHLAYEGGDVEALRARLAASPDVNGVATTGNGNLVIGSRAAGPTLGVLAAAAAASGGRIASLRVEETTLETVFLRLTGRSLRD